MNSFLTERYHALRDFQKRALRERLRDSPKALRMLDFLEAHPDGKFSMPEAVNTIYSESGESFSVRQNRFFKLRKKVQELIETPQEEGKAPVDLLPLELDYLRCRERMNANHYSMARKSLVKLIEDCRRRNVFELLPGAINSLLYCNLALNVVDETEKLCDDLEEAAGLLSDLHQMQALHRRIYSATTGRPDTTKAEALLARCATLARRHSEWPRFRMYHTFISMTAGPASLGRDIRALGKAVSTLERIVREHPDIPCQVYEKHFQEITQYYLASSRGVHAFATGDAEACYQSFAESWDIMSRTPDFRVRKTESVFINKITAEVATGRFHDGLRTAEALIEFHKLQHEEDKRLQGFSILAMIYTYCFNTIPCPDPDFLLGKLDDYIRAMRKSRGPLLGDAYSTKAIFLFMLGRFAEANRIMRKEENAGAFVMHNMPEYTELLKMSPSSPPLKVAALRERIEKKLRQSLPGDRRQNYQRALDLVGLLG